MGIINTTSVITAVRLQEQGGDPAAPGAGYQLLYVKAGGVYAINSASAVVGPLTGDHGSLAGLGDDDHSQYHNDMRGDARYPQLAHTHAGTTNGIKLAQANTHETPDTDSATSSLHHTIGATATTAAAGNHTGPAFVASGASHAAGHVPDPPVAGGTTKFLREDASWQVPPGGTTVNAGDIMLVSQVFS